MLTNFQISSFGLLFPFILQFFLSFFTNNVESILAGEQVDWNRHGFLVKILSRERPGEHVKSCTGALISASLVLTSGKCVVDEATKERLREYVVFLASPNQRQEVRSTAKLLERSDNGVWAMLRIAPQNITELCPPDPAPKWVSRMNFRPSLTKPGLIVKKLDFGNGAINGRDGNVAVATDVSCHMIAFETTEIPEDFLSQKNVFRLYVQLSPELTKDSNEDDQNRINSPASGNFTACYDDGGAPLMCKQIGLFAEETKPALQLGLFQTLIVPGGGAAISDASSEENHSELDKCRAARQMRFNLFHEDVALAHAIERHAFAEFVALYQACGFL